MKIIETLGYICNFNQSRFGYHLLDHHLKNHSELSPKIFIHLRKKNIILLFFNQKIYIKRSIVFLFQFYTILLISISSVIYNIP